MSDAQLASSYQMNTWDKARQINSDAEIYGTYAEIGAGQEVARWFFRAGRASSTIAKTMSAYDMVFSDAIYGKEENKRYVCESRLLKMLKKEYSLVIERLSSVRGDRSKFFAFADTMASKAATDELSGGHGWMGVRFQSHVGAAESDVIIHLRMLDDSSLDQQEAVGIVGVNLIYGCFFYHNDPIKLIETLRDGMRGHQFEIDMIRFSGPAFTKVDNRLLSLHLIEKGLTDTVLISPKGETIQPSDSLFRKHLLVQRGRFRPITTVHQSMQCNAENTFLKQTGVHKKDVISIFEMTTNRRDTQGKQAPIDYSDLLFRIDLIQHLGHHTLVSNYSDYYKLSQFFAKYTNGHVGLVMGVGHLNLLFDKQTYADLRGGLLEALGSLFRDNVKALVYPAYSLNTSRPSPKDIKNRKFFRAENFTPPAELIHLFKHLVEQKHIIDIAEFDEKSLEINSDDIYDSLLKNTSYWRTAVPKPIIALVEKHLKKGDILTDLKSSKKRK